MKDNTQKKINEVCKNRGIPKIKKGSRCTVRFKDGHVVGCNSSENLLVKFVESGDEFSCDPYWKMTVFNNDGSVFYNSEEYTMEERVIDKEENGRCFICWILLAFAIFASSGLIFILSKVIG